MQDPSSTSSAGQGSALPPRTAVATDDLPTPGGDALAAWIDLLHELYPPGDAEPWDAVGLHVGDLAGDRVHGVLVALDVTEATLREAARLGADLLIAHHPLLFRPLARLTADSAPGRLALLAARLGIAVAAAHTNVDRAAEGTSHPAAAALGLQDLRPLVPLARPGRLKLVTFVPQADTGRVAAALAEAGAGRIGGYEGCAFRTAGTGTFRPGPGTDPHIGTPGRQEEVAEDRLETVLDRADLPAVMAALRDAHPYEEVAYDLYDLVDDRPGDRGLGVVGTLPQPTPLRTLADRLAAALANPLVRLAAPGPGRERVGATGGAPTETASTATTVAVVGGAGGRDAVDAALRAGADVLVTGDVTHHVALDALAMGLAVVDAGHWGTEWLAMRGVEDRLGAAAGARGLTAPVHPSTINTDPWTDWT